MENIKKLIEEANAELDTLKSQKKGWFTKCKKTEIDAVASKIKKLFETLESEINNINKSIPNINIALRSQVGTKNLKGVFKKIIEYAKEKLEGKLKEDPDINVDDYIKRLEAKYTPELEERYNNACEEYARLDFEIPNIESINVNQEDFKKVKNILEELEKMKPDRKGNISKKDYEKSIESLEDLLQSPLLSLLPEISQKKEEIKNKQTKKEEQSKKHRSILDMRPKLKFEGDILEKLVKLDQLKLDFPKSDNIVEEKAPQNQLDCKAYIENLLIELVKDIEKYKEKIDFKYPYDLSMKKFNEEQYVEYLKIKGRVIALLAIVTEFTGAYSGKYENLIKEERVSPELEKERELLNKIKKEFLKDFDVKTMNIIVECEIEQYLKWCRGYFIELISTFNEAYEYFIGTGYIYYKDSRIAEKGVGRALMTEWRDDLLEKTLKSEKYSELQEAHYRDQIEHYAICCKYLGLMPKQNLVNHIYYFDRKVFVEFAAAPSYHWDQYKGRERLEIINFDTINELLHKACYEMLKIENIVIDIAGYYILQNKQESGKKAAPHRLNI